MAIPSCLRLFMHLHAREAASRADCTAGKSRATSTPMMAITTSSSTSVKARRGERTELHMAKPPRDENTRQRLYS